MSGGFPVTPTGSPGDIEGLAGSLMAANRGFEGAASALKQTASGLGGIDWSGPAEERFSAAAHGLCRAVSTYHETLADVARALRSYAHALQTAQRVIEDARTEYETAKAAKVDAQIVLSSLRVASARAEEDDRGRIAGQVDDQQAAARRAAHTAEEALKRAIEAREHFDTAQRRARSVLDGGSVIHPPALGGPPLGVANSGTGGGLVGGGFGVPQGGLGNYSATVPWNDVGDLDGLAKNSWDDRHGQTEVDDLEYVIDAALLATGIGGVVKIGFNLSRAAARRLAGMAAAKQSEREAAERALTPAERAVREIGDADDIRRNYIEMGGAVVDKLGVIPQIENISKVAGVLSSTGSRIYITTRVSQALARIQALGDSAKTGLAVLRATGALHQGVRRGIPNDVIARIEQMADDAMRGGRGGR